VDKTTETTKQHTLANIAIRLAVRADASKIAEVHMRSWEVAYKDIIPADFIREKNASRLALWCQLITDENTTKYVIQTDGLIIGFMSIDQARDDDLNDNCYELQAIYLHPDYFRLGAGTHAVTFAFNTARRLGKSNIVVWVLEKNTSSIKFYENCGFIVDGKTQTLNYGKALKAIRMMRNI